MGWSLANSALVVRLTMGFRKPSDHSSGLTTILPILGLAFQVQVWETSQWTWLKTPRKVRPWHFPWSSADSHSSSKLPSVVGLEGCLVLPLSSLFLLCPRALADALNVVKLVKFWPCWMLTLRRKK